MTTAWRIVRYGGTFAAALVSGTLLAGQVTCADSKFAGGEGTEENPWQLSTADHIDLIRHCLSSHFVQINDIDMDIAPYNEGQGWLGPGSFEEPFTGSLQGQGYKIFNLTSNPSGSVWPGGLFQYSDGLIEDVHLRNADVTGTSGAGLLVMFNFANGVIRASSAKGSAVASPNGPAGLIAAFNAGLIETSYGVGTVSVNNDNAGGFVGANIGLIRNSWVRAHASAFDGFAGGFVASNDGEIRSSWSHSTVSAHSSGLFTPVRFWDPTPSPMVIDSFFVANPSSSLLSGGGYPRTVAEMQSLATFTEILIPELNQPWDLNVWTQGGEADNGFPVLRERCIGERLAGGSGTQNDPWLIAEPAHLDTIRRCQQDFIALAADIDLAEETRSWDAGWFPLGAFGQPFSGHMDGRSHVIRNARVSVQLDSPSGFFSELTGTVENLGLEDIEVHGKDRVGGLAGILSGNISNVWLIGQITGENMVGGLVGRSFGTVRNTFVRGAVNGNDFVGGLIGINNGSVDKTYAAAVIDADFFPGGLTALNDGDVRNSFFDQDVSGTSLSGAGTARSTAEMTDIPTYTDISSVGLTDPWDFIGLWDMDAETNDGYPFLRINGVEAFLFRDRFQ